MGCGCNAGLDSAEAPGTNGKQVKTKISDSSVPPQVAEILCLLLIYEISPQKGYEMPVSLVVRDDPGSFSLAARGNANGSKRVSSRNAC
jgi:hypothetical protein